MRNPRFPVGRLKHEAEQAPLSGSTDADPPKTAYRAGDARHLAIRGAMRVGWSLNDDGEFQDHRICEQVLPDSYFDGHRRRAVLSHKGEALWCDLFEFLFCERRGLPAADLDVLDFLAERAAQPRSRVAAVAAA